jgi:hypothetical protein
MEYDDIVPTDILKAQILERKKKRRKDKRPRKPATVEERSERAKRGWEKRRARGEDSPRHPVVNNSLDRK